MSDLTPIAFSSLEKVIEAFSNGWENQEFYELFTKK